MTITIREEAIVSSSDPATAIDALSTRPLSLKECDELVIHGIVAIERAILGYARHGLTQAAIASRIQSIQGKPISIRSIRRHVAACRDQGLLPPAKQGRRADLERAEVEAIFRQRELRLLEQYRVDPEAAVLGFAKEVTIGDEHGKVPRIMLPLAQAFEVTAKTTSLIMETVQTTWWQREEVHPQTGPHHRHRLELLHRLGDPCVIATPQPGVEGWATLRFDPNAGPKPRLTVGVDMLVRVDAAMDAAQKLLPNIGLSPALIPPTDAHWQRCLDLVSGRAPQKDVTAVKAAIAASGLSKAELLALIEG